MTHRSGQMLLEVVVAMGILVLFVTAFISFILGAYDGGTKAREWSQATYLSRQGLEQVRSIAMRDFTKLQDGTYGVYRSGDAYVLSGSLTTHGVFERSVIIESVSRNKKGDITHFGGVEDSSTKKVESVVSWKGRSLTLTTLFSDWRRPRWRFDILTEGAFGRMHATEPLPGTGGIVFRGQGDLSLPQLFEEKSVFNGAVIRDLQVVAEEDRLYVLSQENGVGPEFVAFDLANISNHEMDVVKQTELGTDGVKFIVKGEYAYILTAHGDRDIIKVSLDSFDPVAVWDIQRAAKPIDMAIDETRGRAYVLTNSAEQGKSLTQLPPEIVETGLFVDTVHAQGAPTCNGQTATIYVDGSNNIVSTIAKDNGDPYLGTLNGSNGADVIVGTSGADVINGKNGNDVICGGDGIDTIDGGNNDDVIFGEGGADIITAGNGTNTVCGGAGNDTITGGNGSDSFAGGDGTDSLDGGIGTDICREGEVNLNCEDTTSAIATCGVASGDTTPPSVDTLSPADEAVDVAIATNLVITFTEGVNVVTGNVSIYKSDGTLFEAIDVTSAQVTGDGTATITVNPTSDLANSTSYYVQIDATAFDDLYGNSYVGISDSTTWNFTTIAAADTTPPSVTTLFPTDGATGVSVNTSLQITFDEAVNVVTGNVTIKEWAGGTAVETIDVTSGQVTGGGTDTITINPSVTLNYDSHYYVEVDATAFDDLAGNSFAGITSKPDWDFTTEALVDTTAPVVNTLSPADDATSVDATTNLVITFSEAVNAVTGNVSIYEPPNTLVETIDVTSGQVTGGGTDTITVNPSADLAYATDYYINIDATAFDDLAGNSFGGISNKVTWNFTTATGPTSSSSSSSSTPAGRAKLPPPSEKLYVIDISGSATGDVQDIDEATVIKEVDIGSARRIELAGGYAYILTDNTAAELSIMNLSTYEVTKCDLQGDQLPNDLSIDGTTLYISRNSGIYAEFVSYHIDPSHPADCDSILGHKVTEVELGDDGRSFVVLSEEELAFVLAGFGLSDLHVVDLDKASDTKIKAFSDVDGLCDIADTVGSYIFTGCRGDGSLTVFEGRGDVQDYFLWGTYTAPPFDAGEYASKIHSLKWQTEGEGEIYLRVRSAATEAGLQKATWVGPDGTSETFYDDPSGQDLSLSSIGGGRFVQWKAYFKKTGTESPVLQNVILSFE